ncbi:MAG: YggT family protein [Candidatus Omnitrophica bacterium]|nr:YggT family protein [Candidatus Omnitrophota bacterium]
MFVLGNFLSAAAQILSILLTIIYWLVLIRALISWVNPDPENPIVRFLYAATEPILDPIRHLVPAWKIGVDISPILAFLLIFFLQKFLVTTLLDLSVRLR